MTKIHGSKCGVNGLICEAGHDQASALCWAALPARVGGDCQGEKIRGDIRIDEHLTRLESPCMNHVIERSIPYDLQECKRRCWSSFRPLAQPALCSMLKMGGELLKPYGCIHQHLINPAVA